MARDRRGLVDLLRRRPALDQCPVTSPEVAAGQRVDQLRELLALVDRGVLSAEEFERQQAKVLRDRRPGL